MAVSSSPDSQGVEVADMTGKGAILYCAFCEKDGHRFVSKVTNTDPNRPQLPALVGVEIIDLVGWTSPTSIEIRERYLVYHPPSATPQWEEHI